MTTSECQEGEGHLTNKVTSGESRERGEKKTCRDLERWRQNPDQNRLRELETNTNRQFLPVL